MLINWFFRQHRYDHFSPRLDVLLTNKRRLQFETSQYYKFKFLVITKFKFGESFGMSLRKNCCEFEATANLELLAAFVMNFGGILT
jgi:hypothetical protein